MTAWPLTALPPTLERFMADALALEQEAARRYDELADAMDMCNNGEVARLFRTMAGYERKHAEQIAGQMGWDQQGASVPPPAEEAPEAVRPEELHYLMQPWHALKLALAAEERAEAYFARIVASPAAPEVREAAASLQAEEAEHVALIQSWLAKVPPPPQGWDDDPDPPRYTD
jgi:rubrerythrin